MLSLYTNYYWDLPLEDAIQRIAFAGIKEMELAGPDEFLKSDSPEQRIQQINDICSASGVKLKQVHGYWGHWHESGTPGWIAAVERFKREIVICAKLGIEVIVAHPMDPRDSKINLQKRLDINEKFFGEMENCLKANNMKVAIENQCDEYFGKAEGLLRLIGMLNSDRFGICMDTSHLACEQLNIPEFIKKSNSLLIATHFSDGRKGNDYHLWPAFAREDLKFIDWYAVRQALRDINYRGILNFEVPGEAHNTLEIRDLKLRYAIELLSDFFSTFED